MITVIHSDAPANILQPGDFECEPGSVGPTTGGLLASPSAVQRVRDRGWTGIHMLDVCCGVGTIGLRIRCELGPEIVKSLVLSDWSLPNVRSAQRTVDKYELSGVTVLESDGVVAVPNDPPFDLIVSNPPHFCHDGDPTRHSAEPNWHFHRMFFEALPRFLRPGGEAWLIEAGNGGVPDVAKETLDHSLIETIGWETEPNDTPFSWLILRRR